MKKPYLLMLIIIIAFAETSCIKYEEGPLISFRSKKNRLLGVWKVVEFKKDNEDLTQFYQDTCGCNFEFAYDTSPNAPHSKWQHINILCNENNWNFISSNDDINYFHITQSTWSLFNGEKKLYTQFGVNNDSRYRWGMYPLTVCYQSVSGFDVLRLTSKELWLLYDDLLNIYTFKFEKI